MNQRVKNLWIKALESGEFKQISGKLHDGKGYCALGVLAALAMNEGVCTYSPQHKFDGRTRSISFNIQKWAEIDWDDELDLPKFTPDASKIKIVCKNKELTVADINDAGASFKQIAGIIKKAL
jgi:hypothetical protein